MIQLNQNIQDLQKFNITVKELPTIFNELKVGQIIRGKVMEVIDNEVLLLINGQKLIAQTPLNLDINDNLLLKVQSIKPSIVLQFYGIETASNKDPGSEILRMFDLDKDSINKAIVSSLMKFSLPFSKAEIQNTLNVFNTVLLKIARTEKGIDIDYEVKKVLDTLKFLNIPIEDENLINSISFLKSNNIPVTALTVLKAMIFMSGKQDIGDDLNQLISILQKNTSIPKELSDRISLFLLSGKPDEKIDIEKSISNMGLDYEKRISELFKGKKVKELDLHNNLKGAMLELDNFILNNPKIENAEKLQLLATRILNNIEIQQLLNKDDNNSIGKNWFFQIPVPFGDNFKTVELKISKRKEPGKTYRQSTISFNMKIDMSNLGKVNSSGNLYNKNLSCFFGLENKECCEIFEKDLDFLKSKFQEMGYIISNLKADYSSEVSADFVDNFSRAQNQTALDFKV
jgi:hypothetical protein